MDLDQSLLTQEETADTNAHPEERTPTETNAANALLLNASPSPMAQKVIELPQFRKARPDLFFASLELQFELNGITDELVKYAKLILALGHAELDEAVGDIINNRPAVNPYTALKKAVLACLRPTDLNKIRALLLQERLEDKKPSEFLARLNRIGHTDGADKAVLENDIRDAWFRAMPPEWMPALVGCPDLKAAAEMADNIKAMKDNPFQAAMYEAATRAHLEGSQVAAVVAAQRDSEARMARMEDMITKLSTLLLGQQRVEPDRGRSEHRGRSGDRGGNHGDDFGSDRRGRGGGYRGRSRSRQRFFSGQCYYHHKFGQQAYRCYDGCLHYEAFEAAQPVDRQPENSRGRAQ